jgi:hypothetical protein
MRSLSVVVVLVAAFALGTALFGWWAVVALAALWGALARSRAGAGAALAAAAAWALLLGMTATRGSVLGLAGKVAGIVGLPGAALIALTLLFPALLAWGTAEVAAGVRMAVRGRGRG